MAPMIAVRLACTYGPPDDQVTRRVDLQIDGSRGVAHEDGVATPFETERLWPTVRELLPPVEHLRADPPARRTPRPEREPGPGGAGRCTAMGALAVVTAPDGLATEDPEVAVRTWFATAEDLWEATPTGVLPANPGDLADRLVWDVTGALEALLREAAS